jgi:signal transduction histidine kinase
MTIAKSQNLLWAIYTSVCAIVFAGTQIWITRHPDVLMQPHSTFMWVMLIVPTALVIAPVLGILRNRPTHLRTWLIFVLAPLLSVASLLVQQFGPPGPFPGPGSYISAASIALPIVFLSLVLRHRSARPDAAGSIDATIIATAAFLISWVFVISPNAHIQGVSTAAKTLDIGLAVAHLILVWLCVQIAFDGGTRSTAHRILTLSFIGSALLDTLIAATHFTMTIPMSVVDVATLTRNILYVLILTTPLHPSMRLLTAPATVESPDQGTGMRIVFVTLAALVSPALLISEHFRSSANGLLVIAIGSAVMFLLVVARMEGMIRKQMQTNAALDESLRKLKIADIQLRHAQKMQAVGKLAAGIAHEINTPLQTVTMNLRYVESTFEAMNNMATAYHRFMPRELQERESAFMQTATEDLETFNEEVPLALGDMSNQLERMAAIVSAMKAFGDFDNSRLKEVNVNQAIQNTLAVAQNEIDPVADILTDFADVPVICCYPGDLNEILLNVVLNAAQAVRAQQDSDATRGTLMITTSLVDEEIVIVVRDSGVGIPQQNLDRVFEPFFTTRDVGSGTGQGLAVVWNLVVERYKGRLQVESELGLGTTFTITLPSATLPSADLIASN